MRRVAIFPLMGPALVLYLVADASQAASRAGHAPLDAFAYALSALAVLLSLSLLAGRGDAEEPGTRRVGFLGLAAGGSLLGLLSTQPLRISVDVAEALSLAGAGALSLDLALHVPDAIVAPRYRRWSRALIYAGFIASAVLSLVALGPVLAPFGSPWLVPARFVAAPALFAALGVVVALGLRLARRWLGSTPEALASNHWAVLALLPACALALALGLCAGLGVVLALPVLRIAGSVSAIALYVGHLWLIDPRRRLASGRTLREIVAVASSMALVSAAVLPLRAHLPEDALPFGLAVAALLCVAVALLQLVSPHVQRALSPARGRLLDAVRGLPESTAGVHTLESLARVELGLLRRASGSPTSAPMLYGFDPAFEARIDAAGQAHLSSRTLHPALMERLRAVPGEIIVRAPLEAQIVRNPPLRPLIEALVEHDALCVLPLVTDGELEGALIVPRGERRSLLTLEELSALGDHARFLSALLSVFAAQGRAEKRVERLITARDRAEARAEQLEDEAARLRSDVEHLHAGRSARAEAAPLIAYSPGMRALLERIRGLASLDVPVCLTAAPGLPLAPLARFLHHESGREVEPLLTVDCASLRAEESACVLFGGDLGGVHHAGALRVAGRGTLLLTDVSALSPDAQRQLTAALSSRTSRAIDGNDPYDVLARVVVGSRVDLAGLAAEGRFDAELAARLSPVTLRVPPLCECPEDIASHALLALDRACRRMGRPVVGLSPEALAALGKHPWPENLAELERVIERSVQRARGERLQLAELVFDAEAPSATADEPLAGTLEEIEHRALSHALARAGGNKSEAARLLGLPRTTLLDKLRRHKLDDGARESSTPPN